MLGFLERVRSRRSGPTVIVECRDCGTTVDGDSEPCPACGSGELARYEIRE